MRSSSSPAAPPSRPPAGPAAPPLNPPASRGEGGEGGKGGEGERISIGVTRIIRKSQEATPPAPLQSFPLRDLSASEEKAAPVPGDDSRRKLEALTLEAETLKKKIADQAADFAKRLAAETEKAKSEGRREGRAAAGAEAAEREERLRNAMRAELAQALRLLEEDRKRLFLALEGEAVSLVGVALRRGLPALGRCCAEILPGSLAQAVRALGGARSLTVKVNPGQGPLAEASRSLWFGGQETSEIRIVEDTGIAPGCCLVEGDGSTSRLDLEDLAARMEEELGKVFQDRLRRAGFLEADGAAPPEAEDASAAADGMAPREGGPASA